MLHARGDRLVPWRSGRYLADHISGARFELLDVKDHAIWFAAQDAYLDAITGFLEWQPEHTPERGRVGVSDEEAVHLYYDLLVYTLGFVAWELPRTRSITRREYAKRWRSAVDRLDEADHPTIHRLVAPLTTVASDRQFEGGLRRIIGPL